jgi:hypothetical protein
MIGMALIKNTEYITNLQTIVDNPTSKVGKTFLKAKEKYEYKKIISSLLTPKGPNVHTADK